jgi:P27 family predicted phage terminase small subunit
LLAGDQLKNPQRINRAEPEPAAVPVEPPYPLREEAQIVWDRLAPDLIAKKVLTPWDVDHFVVFCDAVATYRECRAQLDFEGYTAQGSAGGVIKSPYWQIMRDAASIMSAVGSRYGLTPSDRTRLTMDDPDDKPRGAERLLG